ncbi:hypothetical protein [Calycomorphotria hydatis]|nr:hypothetical protein [Calycomorphotria hydatis]
MSTPARKYIAINAIAVAFTTIVYVIIYAFVESRGQSGYICGEL